MSHEESFESFLSRNIDKDILRFIACGSVDDGKSTLLGRLLYDSKRIYDDQLASVKADSKRYGTTGSQPDLALLLDGLQEEREQGITIDVAYRYFSTDKRKFIIADTPGHEQYTRNMATGASTADLAVILIDARNGVLRQTRRHSYIAAAMGIQYILVAINKMDLVSYDQSVFDSIRKAYSECISGLQFSEVRYVPVSALVGDNVVQRSEKMPWYSGEPILSHLENAVIPHTCGHIGLRFPVQLVNRYNADFRGYCGTIAAGSMQEGQKVKVLPTGSISTIAHIYDGSGRIASASDGQAVTMTLADKVDVGKGYIIVDSEDSPTLTNTAIARIVWMADHPLRPGDLYDFKIGVQFCQGSVEAIINQIDMERNIHAQSDELAMNDIGKVKIRLQCKTVLDEYAKCKWTGSFIMIDRLTNMTAGAGMIVSNGETPANADRPDVFWHHQSITKETRSYRKKQKPRIIWFTGLSGAGKSTIANALERQLYELGYHTYLLDGDNLRYGLNKDLGFTPAERTENIRRAGEVAKLMVDAGLIVLCSFVSPYRKDRDAIRASVDKGEFFEVYVSTPIEICEKRDVKGLYAKARDGVLKGMTGIASPYEPPSYPEAEIDASELSVDSCARKIYNVLFKGTEGT